MDTKKSNSKPSFQGFFTRTMTKKSSVSQNNTKPSVSDLEKKKKEKKAC